MVAETDMFYRAEPNWSQIAPAGWLPDVHVVGIRSKTMLTEEVLKEAQKLLVIGCFCIGTNQVDLELATSRGIAVFNSPFSNSRSVAELVLAEVIALARKVGDLNTAMYQGKWVKPTEVHELRGKTLEIVGYGHIGSQLSVLAGAFGIHVIFYDIIQIMPLGTAKQVPSLENLLKTADFVTLHVPETLGTKNMIGEKELAIMKKGSYLINASRGTVVDIPALKHALKSGHLGGAAVDVFPTEPFANGKNFENELQGCDNTILTLHIGGSTEEAQSSIGVEVAAALIKYVSTGSTMAAVNFPEADLRMPTAEDHKTVRILNTHQNVPGVLKILSEYNIEKQICDSRDAIGYLMADVSVENEAELKRIHEGIGSIRESIMTRILF
ncbi:hypothetical protein BJ742DRAFT_825241 [Cladochytrium replicatum]|nr:hypothetical protein BJ742DRAFT_825241 [Cladochytrium replicatum]